MSVRVNAHPCTQDITDLLAAYMVDSGYESFLPDGDGLTAYIPYEKFEDGFLSELIGSFPIECTLDFMYERIEGQDWNHEWEKNYFQPIVIGNKCVVHSTFHKDIPTARYDISIDPKMAFGTGHHSTTRLIMNYLLNTDIKGESVIDMGTGTGILAILCCMLGASQVTGIEIDPMAFRNAMENAALNNVSPDLREGNVMQLKDVSAASIFIANINRNIILADLADYSEKLLSGGKMILSGFYEKDITIISSAAKEYGLNTESYQTEGEWAALILRKI